MTTVPGSQGGYQGYPYRNPTVTEVQSVDQDTASRWANLPRKKVTDGRGDRNINSTHGSSTDRSNVLNDSDNELSRNVNTDLPIINPGQINQRRNELRSVQNSGYQGYPYSNPVPTDVQSVDPETAFKWANLPRNQNTDRRENRNTSGCGPPRPDQKPTNDEPNMNVFIDIPIIDPREMNTIRDDTRSDGDNSGFVEETIFYDPFEDRRINDSRNQETPPAPSGSLPGSGVLVERAPVPGISNRPDPKTQAPTPPLRQSLMSKEAQVYGSRTRDDGFPVSPIPVSEFPEPPPAYSEVDRRRIVTEQPRTVVVVPDPSAPVGISSNERKLLVCPHCRLQVNTLVIQENGLLTHVLAGIFLFVFAPITCVIYCSNYCKYKNHYCPNCNQLIGYEVPILCQDMVYTKV